MNFKNIIFDLGGVIIDIDYNLAAAAFKRLGVINFEEIYSKKQQDNFFNSFETGHLSNENFRIAIRKHIPTSVTDEQIDTAWNAMLINIPQERFNWLKDIGKIYRIFLLSNTNRIHIKAFTEIFNKQFGDLQFEKLFEKVYYSCEIGMRKPNPEIFDFVIKENNLVVSETLFIDDSPQHIEGARNFGVTAWHLENDFKVESLFK